MFSCHVSATPSVSLYHTMSKNLDTPLKNELFSNQQVCLVILGHPACLTFTYLPVYRLFDNRMQRLTFPNESPWVINDSRASHRKWIDSRRGFRKQRFHSVHLWRTLSRAVRIQKSKIRLRCHVSRFSKICAWIRFIHSFIDSSIVSLIQLSETHDKKWNIKSELWNTHEASRHADTNLMLAFQHSWRNILLDK